MGKQDKPHALCGAKKRNGTPCKGRPMPNGRCRMHGGPSTGPKPENAKGNQNGRKHGLFASSLGVEGLAIYQQAKGMQPEEIARDSAEFLVAKVAEACKPKEDLEQIKTPMAHVLRQMVAAGQITREQALDVLNRVDGPDVATLARALAPLKGLLEVKKQNEEQADAAPEWAKQIFGAGGIVQPAPIRPAQGSEGDSPEPEPV